MNPPTKAYTVDVTKEGVFVDGTSVYPMTLTSLTAVLGEPRVVPPDEPVDEKGNKKNHVLNWDAAGIKGYTEDMENGEVSEIDLILYDDPESDPKYDSKIDRLHSAFSGVFLINGKPAVQAIPEKKLQEAYIYVDTKLGNWQLSFELTKALQRQIKDEKRSTEYLSYNKDNASEIIRNADTPFSNVAIWYKAPRVASGKYAHKKPQGEILVFKNLNFKLAIVQELMYNQRLIEPVFDVYDFSKDYTKREIDIDSEGYEIIPEVHKWFKDLPVSAALADKVETLYLDGGNDVYLQLCPLWDGEDGVFDIKAITPEELAQFPNLKRIDAPGINLSPKVRKLLNDNGITLK
jgi:hypothetical protein